jgi:hypothetical protein
MYPKLTHETDPLGPGSWWMSHTEEDRVKIISHLAKVSLRKQEQHQRKACAQGNHGFGLRTVAVVGSKIYSRCTYCNRELVSDDIVFTI